MENSHEIIGEIIESSTVEFAAESRKLYSPPLFGSFVKVAGANNIEVSGNNIAETQAGFQPEKDDPFIDQAGGFGRNFDAVFGGADLGSNIEMPRKLNPAIFGIVYNASTSPVNKGSRLRAFWKDEAQLREEQPQLEEWHLLTEFRAIIIGYCDDWGALHQFIPPKPPRVHAFVEPCTDDEVCAITNRLDFLRTLANFNNAPVEEVIAACIREAYRAQKNTEFLISAGKELASLLKNDYDKLQAIIRRIGQ